MPKQKKKKKKQAALTGSVARLSLALAVRGISHYGANSLLTLWRKLFPVLHFPFSMPYVYKTKDKPTKELVSPPTGQKVQKISPSQGLHLLQLS